MDLLPEWAPNFHPMVVHFPLALLSVAFLFDLIAFFLPQKAENWVDNTTITLYVIGTLSAIGVYFTGTSAADEVFLPAGAQSVLNTHADWALLTVWFYSFYTVLRILARWIVNKVHWIKVHVVFFILSIAGLFMLYQTGDNGAKMVFQYGVGVQASSQQETEGASEYQESTEASTGFKVQQNGDWSWNIQSSALQTLDKHFDFLNGSTEQLNIETIVSDNSYSLQFSGDNLSGFIVSDEIYQNVQVDYYLDLSDFEGVVTLANHVEDHNNYDYVSITSEGKVEQGRITGGQTEVFETGNTDVSSPIFVRVVANDTHFRGYVDKEMIVHGHGDAPAAGGVGLKIEGNGIVQLQKMELVQLKEE